MADRKHSPTTSSFPECGWKFHSLSPINSSVNSGLSRESVDDSDDGSKGTEDEPVSTSYQQMASEFHRDGFLCLSGVFPPDFVDMLRSETMGLFASCLHHLRENGQVEFEQSWRRRRRRRSMEDGDVVLIQKNYSSTPERESRNLENSSAGPTTNRAKKCSRADEDTPSVYEYPLKVGLKHGYQELVMRSPGRYEMALLLDDAVHKIITPNMHSARGNDQATNTEQELPNHNSRRSCGEKGYYNGKWLMDQKMYEKSFRQQSNIGNTGQCNAGVNIISRDSFQRCHGQSRSCLLEILDCVKHSEHNTSANAYFPDEKRGSGAKSIVSYQMQQLLELVRNIYSPLSTNSVAQPTNAITSGHCSQCRSATDNPMDNDFYLCNLSLLVATPGCPTQARHADGGHVSMSTHELCHCFNVFVPLVDVPLEMGPTELRPGTHYHTRNLAPMMLAAKARKTLQPPVTPLLRKGDALIFDYRILHRGKANLSDTVNAEGDSEGCLDKTCREGSDCKNANANDNIFKVGRDRPILVMTFARRWFVDVCNFPKRSVFSLTD